MLKLVMATKQSTIDFITEQVSDAGEIRSQKMFGEYALYCDEKVVAFVCDDKLFIKITPKSLDIVGEGHEAPAYPGSKPYLLIDEDFWDDKEWMSKLIRETAEDVPLKIKKT